MQTTLGKCRSLWLHLNELAAAMEMHETTGHMERYDGSCILYHVCTHNLLGNDGSQTLIARICPYLQIVYSLYNSFLILSVHSHVMSNSKLNTEVRKSVKQLQSPTQKTGCVQRRTKTISSFQMFQASCGPVLQCPSTLLHFPDLPSQGTGGGGGFASSSSEICSLSHFE